MCILLDWLQGDSSFSKCRLHSNLTMILYFGSLRWSLIPIGIISLSAVTISREERKEANRIEERDKYLTISLYKEYLYMIHTWPYSCKIA